MKTMIRYLLVTVAAGGLMLSQAAFAGSCCKETAKKTQNGETCAACETSKCCKKAAEKAAKKGKAKECEKCAAKKKEKKAS